MPSSPEISGRRIKRVSKSKVRTGCVTCKIRRIKCDEGKPECVRCTSTGRKCDGYLPPKTWLFELNSESESSSSSSMPSSSSTGAPDSSEERQALQFYEDRTAPTLANYYSPQFWKVTVPSTGLLHPPIKHIVVATAELHASIEEVTDQTGLSRLRFMQHYSKAVSLLTKGSTTLPTEVVLICCLLFSTCENFQGDPMAGLLHIEGGAKILREWRAAVPQGLSRTEPQVHRSDLIEQEVAPIIDSVEALISTSRSVIPGQPQASQLKTPGEGLLAQGSSEKPLISQKYDTFCVARDQLNDAIQWMRRTWNWEICGTTSTVIDPAVTIEDARALLSGWLVAFNGYTPQPGGMHEREFLRTECLLLRAHHHAAVIMIETLPSNSEMVFDEHVDKFRTLLEECSAAAIPPISPAITFHFGFSLGLIPPLFLLATRCREPSMRKQAVAVLRSLHRSEGCWDSCSAALLAEHVINIEERGLAVIETASDITAFSRVRLMGAEVDYANQQLVLRVARYPFSGMSPFIRHEEPIEWRTIARGQNRDTLEWISQPHAFDPRPDEDTTYFPTSTAASSLSAADSPTIQPLDRILGAAGFQGLIRPERGICWHTATMNRGGGDTATVTGSVETGA
ncbi:hypothetical protein EPUS_06872 [Endocarpon pusillum Z07020]|uniref:Zn(2)-C6 fungal-type domain-containing protein n=1 Tax=Endocarpon pusillum (strain Z07020 / HMAS-L-300199) TaxID=1263415 RepID=U1I4G3_ENDPU|nr:uncharacterized protein EPUS_06872 [Endocarpon pusillum Z07020]ERF77004.1 hypothetical protein EPUS_06872 [Endocarpon pusillum Z07020]